MSREDWVGVFWVAFIVATVAGLIMFAVLGFWWKEWAGLFFGVGTFTFIVALALAVSAYRQGFGGGGGRD